MKGNLEADATVAVPKAKALLGSGKKKGRLRPGCRFKGKKVLCTPAVAARLRGTKSGGRKKAKGKRKGTGKHPCASASPPPWCNKKGRKGKKGKKGRKGGVNRATSSPIAIARHDFKVAKTCQAKMNAVRFLNQMAGSKNMGPIFDAEVQKKIKLANAFCQKKVQASRGAAARAAEAARLDGLRGLRRR